MQSGSVIDHTEIDWYVDPYPDYARLRESGEPLWLPNGETYSSDGIWLFSHHHEAEKILKLTSSVSKDISSRRYQDEGSPFDTHMLNRDGADHVRLRRLITNEFSSTSLRKLEVVIRSAVNRLVVQMSEKTHFDFIADFAEPLPLWVISAMIGVPADDRYRVRRWSLMLSEGADSQMINESLINQRRQTLSEFIDYIEWLLRLKSKEPGDDMISRLLPAEASGEISHEEMLGMVSFLLFAGHETTVSLIGSLFWLLLTHPQQWLLLRESPELAASAVEEALRYESPTQRSTARFALEPIIISGFRVEAGQQLAVILGSANRDEAVFPEADKFDIRRSSNRHLAFGVGVHNCLGKNLARLEAKIALHELLNLPVQPGLVTEAPAWRRNSFFRGLEKLPLELG